ncbi:MAG: ATP-binding protein [Lentisphaeraceae bacterium]|nr:ATP-binding protein [Lentisphaeraceae bacterium]
MKKVLLCAWVVILCLDVSGGSLDSLTRIINPQIDKIEAEIRSLKTEDEKLPPFSIGNSGIRKGFHSYYYKKKDTPLQIKIDLGKEYRLDLIALFFSPTNFQGRYVEDYGLPEEFTIDASSDESFESFIELYKHTNESKGYGLYPLVFKPKKTSAQFIRIKVTKHWTRDDGKFFSAFRELNVISGNQNVALHKFVKTKTNAMPPKWKPEYLVDGQTHWGVPISTKSSQTNGFISSYSSRPDSEKWIMLDLGQEYNLQDIRLIPANPLDTPSSFSYGFPLSFKIETSLTADFKSTTLVANEVNFHPPGGSSAIYTGVGRARFVKVSASNLRRVIGEDQYALSFAEIQAYSSEGNVALHCKVTTSCEADFPNYRHLWNKAALVDGYNSQNELVELSGWLVKLDTKRKNMVTIYSLEKRLVEEVKKSNNWLIYFTTAAIVILLFFLVLNQYKRKKKLELEVDKLRTQISRDLHDDLGSRLGGIRLLSEFVMEEPGLSEANKEDLRLINNSAIGAVEAMRDIVWLTDGKDVAALALAQHLHTVCQESLNQLTINWLENCQSSVMVSFYLRRHLVFAFRESLGNILKHSKATEVSIEVLANEHEFSFKVTDNGCGFDPKKVNAHNGFLNFKQRAKKIHGSFHLDSSLGNGTTINFKANL